MPRLIVAGTHSGVGKTTVAVGLMAALARRRRQGAGVPLLGWLPPAAELTIPERHLGLIGAAERDLAGLIAHLADAVEEGLDVPGILELARSAGPLPGTGGREIPSEPTSIPANK